MYFSFAKWWTRKADIFFISANTGKSTGRLLFDSCVLQINSHHWELGMNPTIKRFIFIQKKLSFWNPQVIKRRVLESLMTNLGSPTKTLTKLGGRRKRWDGKIILSLWTGNLRCHERWLQEKKAPCGPGRFARRKYSTNRISRPESSPEPTADETENEGFHPFHCQIKCTAQILFGVFIYTSTVKLNQASANCFRRRNRPVNMKGLEQNFSRQ